MNITILGATGMAGTAIAQEATRRGHHVTSVSRNPPETNDPHTTCLLYTSDAADE